MDSTPRWPGLNHFRSIMNVSFTDGSKHEDIAKVGLFITMSFCLWLSQYQLLPFAAHTVLTEEKSPLGYRLLRCLRSFLVMDTYAAMEVHTEDTIAAGRAEIIRFSELIEVRRAFRYVDSWNID